MRVEKRTDSKYSGQGESVFEDVAFPFPLEPLLFDEVRRDFFVLLSSETVTSALRLHEESDIRSNITR